VKRIFVVLLTAVAFVLGLIAATPAQAAPASATTGAQAAAACPFDFRHEFQPGEVFEPGECYTTPGGTLIMQHDGNLVIYDNAWQPICDSGTAGFHGAVAIFQHDGNLVIYWNGKPIKHSVTHGYPGSVLIFNVNARLRIRNAEGRLVWDMCNNGFRSA